MIMKRLRIHVSGIVQGVGYRYFAMRKAQELGIKGYVMNLNDGRVLVVAEGDEDALDKFISSLREGPKFAKVNGMEIEEDVSNERFKRFEIRY